MKKPEKAITLSFEWQPSAACVGDEWAVWEDRESEDWCHVSAEHVASGAIFAILKDGYPKEASPDIYAVFLGVREGHELPPEDDLSELGRTALAVFSKYFHESRCGIKAEGAEEERPV